MEVAKITSKGQITIPISIRRKLELSEGDKVLFIYKSEGVMMVNPNNMQGGIPIDISEEAEHEAETVPAAPQPVAAAQAAPPAPPAPTIREPEPAVNETEISTTPPEQTATPAPEPEEQRRFIPPPAEEPEPPKDKHVGGFNLSTLLDDIRSIGSNI